MNPVDPRVPEPERRKIKNAIEGLEADYDAGRRPDLAAVVPANPFRIPYLLALIPIDMACRLKYFDDRAGAALESYLAAFPELRADQDGMVQLIHAEYAAHREATRPDAEGTRHDVRARFNYRDLYPDLWPKLFPYAETSRLPEPGERVGARVRVEHRLGCGGMGVVFRCRDEALDRVVATKLLDPAGPRFPDAVIRGRFLREAQALARVTHSNVVKVHAADEVGGGGWGVPYFVMEFIDGAALDGRLQPGTKLSPQETMGLARGMASGLQAIHEANLVHRDVAPRNVMIRPGGEPVLLDLGLVRSLGSDASLTESGTTMGTARYMAPEQAADSKCADCRADLFGLGCILYQAVTGTLAFPGENLMEVLVQLRTHEPEPPDDARLGLPSGLGNLISRLMAKRREDRPPGATAVLAELDAIEAGNAASVRLDRPAPAPPVLTPSASTVRPRRSRRKWAAGGAVAGLVLFAVLLVKLLPSSGPKTTDSGPSPPVEYRGGVNVEFYRKSWLTVTHPEALPLKAGDHFVVYADIEPPAYLYVFWIDPDGAVAPIYPWHPDERWGGRPASERPVTRIRIPETGDLEPEKNPPDGVTTIVAFASPKRLACSDDEIRGWFNKLPRVAREKGDLRATEWFVNYKRLRGTARLPKTTGSVDPYERWQAELQKRVGTSTAHEMSISFAQGDK